MGILSARGRSRPCRTAHRSAEGSGCDLLTELIAILNRVSCLALLLAIPILAHAGQTATPCQLGTETTGPVLRVDATGARRVAGSIAFTLYGADATRFLKSRGSLAIVRVPLAASGAEAGTYAVAIYHDENDNRHFDRNFLGLPVEGYGFTNDAPTFLGPPSFEAARIAVHPGENRVRVRLRY